jgi:hypothetical protein
LREEAGIVNGSYYMEETEALMHAFGLAPYGKGDELAARVEACEMIDRTDYSELRKKRAVTPAETPAPPSDTAPPKSWWKFW